MPWTLLLSKWKEIALVLLVLGSLYFVYNKIYDRGYQAAEQVWVEKETKRITELNEKIDRIEGFARTNLEHTILTNEEVRKDIKGIKIKGSTTIIKNGECAPSPEFITIYNSIIERGNKK